VVGVGVAGTVVGADAAGAVVRGKAICAIAMEAVPQSARRARSFECSDMAQSICSRIVAKTRRTMAYISTQTANSVARL
jgi:hypothetical protein